jgi:hypothetical protein
MNDSKRMTFWRWEKWRIGYNLILLVESLWLLRERLAVVFADSLFMRFVVSSVIAANVCYCLGPLIEMRVWTLWGSRTDRTRYRSFLAGLPYFLFWMGLGFSMLLVYILVIHSCDYLDGYQ